MRVPARTMGAPVKETYTVALNQCTRYGFTVEATTLTVSVSWRTLYHANYGCYRNPPRTLTNFDPCGDFLQLTFCRIAHSLIPRSNFILLFMAL